MASKPPQTSDTVTHVFRATPDLTALEVISPGNWQHIVDHTLPLQPANAEVKLLLVTGRGTTCETVDALQLQTDSYGFLLTWDASSAQSEHQTGQAQSATSNVIDSRHRFLRRYLSHRHGWQPSTSLVAEALIRAGYAQSIDA